MTELAASGAIRHLRQFLGNFGYIIKHITLLMRQVKTAFSGGHCHVKYSGQLHNKCVSLIVFKKQSILNCIRDLFYSVDRKQIGQHVCPLFLDPLTVRHS